MYLATERIAKAVRAAVQLHAASERARVGEIAVLQVEAFLAALVEDAVSGLPADVVPTDLRAALISGEAVGPYAAVWWPRVREWQRVYRDARIAEVRKDFEQRHG
jgi:hypothetical protein